MCDSCSSTEQFKICLIFYLHGIGVIKNCPCIPFNEVQQLCLITLSVIPRVMDLKRDPNNNFPKA